MSNWDNFKKKESEDRPVGREIGGCYKCQFCNAFVFKATYFPLDSVLKYRCDQDHLNFIEDFKVAF